MQLHLDGRPLDEHAMDVLRLFEPKDGRGYDIAYSGGKDSEVVLSLAKRSGVKFTARYCHCALDPIELRRHIADMARDPANRLRVVYPERSLIEIAKERGIMPQRQRRWCCEVIKERKSETGRPIVTGIRWAESTRRKKRTQIEVSTKADAPLVHPIIEWKTSDVWQYLRERGVEPCCLYAEGYRRLGCVGCPMSNYKEQQFARFPHGEKIWRQINEVTWKAKGYRCFKTAEDQWLWWIDGHRSAVQEPTPLFYGQENGCQIFDGILE